MPPFPPSVYVTYEAMDRSGRRIGGFDCTLNASDELDEVFNDARGDRRFFLEQVPRLREHSRVAILWYLGIDRDQQRKGYGRHLMNSALAVMKDLAQEFVILEVDQRMLWCSDEFERKELEWRAALYEKSGWVSLKHRDNPLNHHRPFMYVDLTARDWPRADEISVSSWDGDIQDIMNRCDPFECDDDDAIG